MQKCGSIILRQVSCGDATIRHKTFQHSYPIDVAMSTEQK